MKYAIALSTILAATAAHAAVPFPPDASYLPLHCGNAVMTDLVGDQPGFVGDGDVVGDTASPAAFTAADATNLYVRIRLDGDPAPGGALLQASWGMAIDLDNDVRTYELLMLVDGNGPNAVVELFTNKSTSMPNSPADPADLPPIASQPFAMNGRSVTAGGSQFNNNPDFFLDFALPWSTLQPAGLGPTTPVHVWIASSSASNALNGDFACHDGASGAPQSDTTASGATTGDPTMGGGPTGPSHLQGTESCSAAGGGSGAIVALALLALRRRRSR
jgi:large repetitive protein